MIHYWWVPLLILTTVVYYYYTKQANDTGSITSMAIVFAIQALGLWPWVARFSRNLFFDGLLFDSILMFTYIGVMYWLGVTQGFTVWHWGGTAMVVAGLFLLKLA